MKERLHQYTPDQVLASQIRLSRGAFCTVSDLLLVVQQWYQFSYQSETTYLNLLHECGLSYQRTERVYLRAPAKSNLPTKSFWMGCAQERYVHE